MNSSLTSLFDKPVIGALCFIQTLPASDISHELINWLKDSEVNKYLEVKKENIDLPKQENYVSKINKSANSVYLGIYDLDFKILIGSSILRKLNDKPDSISIGIMIGNKQFWGKKYGSEVLNLVSSQLSIAGYRFLIAGVHPNNKPSISLFTRNGFIRNSGEMCNPQTFIRSLNQ